MPLIFSSMMGGVWSSNSLGDTGLGVLPLACERRYFGIRSRSKAVCYKIRSRVLFTRSHGCMVIVKRGIYRSLTLVNAAFTVFWSALFGLQIAA